MKIIDEKINRTVRIRERGGRLEARYEGQSRRVFGAVGEDTDDLLQRLRRLGGLERVREGLLEVRR